MNAVEQKLSTYEREAAAIGNSERAESFQTLIKIVRVIADDCEASEVRFSDDGLESVARDIAAMMLQERMDARVEIERLRAKVGRCEAELATLRALVGEVPRALVAGLPEVVSRLVEQAEGQTLPPGCP